jgi:hypothetical protein
MLLPTGQGLWIIDGDSGEDRSQFLLLVLTYCFIERGNIFALWHTGCGKARFAYYHLSDGFQPMQLVGKLVELSNAIVWIRTTNFFQSSPRTPKFPRFFVRQFLLLLIVSNILRFFREIPCAR